MHKVQLFILYSNKNNVWKQIIHSCQTSIRALKITRYLPQPFESVSKLIKQKAYMGKPSQLIKQIQTFLHLCSERKARSNSSAKSSKGNCFLDWLLYPPNDLDMFSPNMVSLLL